jgi:hypothetical protein
MPKKQPETLEEKAIKMMRERAFTGDEEVDHVEADKILIWLLRQINCNDLADLWEKVEKWYA